MIKLSSIKSNFIKVTKRGDHFATTTKKAVSKYETAFFVKYFVGNTGC